jgi:glycosyltransferase involved in cell wall biosynthesis
MTRLKGGPIMFDAVAAAAPLLNRPIQLVLVGDGPERAAWERIANRVAASNPGNISIEFRGTLDHVMLGRTMRNSDLLIVPSTWPEPFGLVGPEAGLRGLPAVAFSVGGIPEWLTDGINGRLAPGDPPSADGLARAIVQCVRDPDELARMGRRACESFSSGRFALDRHVSELLRIFERAIEPDAAARSC